MSEQKHPVTNVTVRFIGTDDGEYMKELAAELKTKRNA